MYTFRDFHFGAGVRQETTRWLTATLGTGPGH